MLFNKSIALKINQKFFQSTENIARSYEHLSAEKLKALIEVNNIITKKDESAYKEADINKLIPIIEEATFNREMFIDTIKKALVLIFYSNMLISIPINSTKYGRILDEVKLEQNEIKEIKEKFFKENENNKIEQIQTNIIKENESARAIDPSLVKRAEDVLKVLKEIYEINKQDDLKRHKEINFDRIESLIKINFTQLLTNSQRFNIEELKTIFNEIIEELHFLNSEEEKHDVIQKLRLLIIKANILFVGEKETGNVYDPGADFHCGYDSPEVMELTTAKTRKPDSNLDADGHIDDAIYYADVAMVEEKKDSRNLRLNVPFQGILPKQEDDYEQVAIDEVNKEAKSAKVVDKGSVNKS